MVVFGRPKGDRGSYIPYREDGVVSQVAFEILSPGNRPAEMRRKLAFYERYGIREYYFLDPDYARHRGDLCSATGVLEPVADLFGWVSPLLGVRFEMTATMIGELRIIGVDGLKFEFYETESAGRGPNFGHGPSPSSKPPLSTAIDRSPSRTMIASAPSSGR